MSGRSANRGRLRVGASLYHAGASAARATGFSTIGRLITAESTPNSTESHHTESYEWVYSNARPPSQTPRKPPTWWLKNAKPNSIASQRDQAGGGRHRGEPEEAADRPEHQCRAGARRQHDEGDDRQRAGEIDERQDVALGNAVAEPARQHRAEDVEQADQA